MRLKEFYQLEFQIIYSNTTKADYSQHVLPTVERAIADLIGSCNLQLSDRVPDYAEWTQDVVNLEHNLEVCSISQRKDFDGAKVLEVAVGTDRCVYCCVERKS
jgi:hypothetical protein